MEISGWVAFLDIYGFRTQLEHNFFSAAAGRLYDMQAMIEKTPGNGTSSNFVMFADSVVLWQPSAKADDVALACFLDKISIVQRTAARFDFLLRGGGAFGQILVSRNYILGDAYIRAYSLEAAIDGPIVAIEKRDLVWSEQLAHFEPRIKDIPTKSTIQKKGVQIDYVPWEQVQHIRDVNIAAINSSDAPNKQALVLKWEAIKERGDGE